MNFESITITPQTVNTNGSFIISVKIQENTHETLKAFIQGLLSRFTHRQLSKDLIK